MAVNDKTIYFGRAGEYFAMSELLLRGWNVAVPVVDVGDDVFVINDDDKTTWRVQVKTTMDVSPGTGSDGSTKARFTLSRAQLGASHDTELFYMLMMRGSSRWRYLVIARKDLFAIHRRYLGTPRVGPGRPPVSDQSAKNDKLGLDITIDEGGASGWNASLTAFLETWPRELSVVGTGPGSRLGRSRE